MSNENQTSRKFDPELEQDLYDLSRLSRKIYAQLRQKGYDGPYLNWLARTWYQAEGFLEAAE